LCIQSSRRGIDFVLRLSQHGDKSAPQQQTPMRVMAHRRCLIRRKRIDQYS
jgi:hypothetical protein